jgi:glycerol uptake facilitator-like aquaporin
MPSAAARVESRALLRPFAGEALGTAILLAAVVGSGIMAESLTRDVAVQLLCNAIATGAALFVLIVVFAPVSGAHFNPAVTMVAVLNRTTDRRAGFVYLMAQVLGAIAGVFLAHAMFGADIFALGVKARSGFPQWLSEGVATFGLVLTIAGTAGRSRETVAAAVALYIVAAYWFTASTSFANPAVTLARALTPSFAGIDPLDAPAFIAAQLIGAMLAWRLGTLLFTREDATSGG